MTPPFDPAERAMRAAAVRTFETFMEAAHIAGVRYCLSSGTLLGCIRDCDFCEGDADDIDVSVMEEDWSKLGGLTEGLWFRATDRFIYREHVEGVKIELVDNPVHVDIQRMRRHRARPEVYNIGRVNINGQRVFVADVYPAHHFEEFNFARFHGLRVPVPAGAEALLAWRYGPEWRTPLSREAWDWPRRIPNDCVKLEYDELTR